VHKQVPSIVVALVMIGIGSGVAMADHDHEDILVGWTDLGVPGGDAYLAIEFGHDNEGFDEDHALPAVYGPLFYGWFGNQPGFAHLEEDEPDEDFYTLDEGVEVTAEIIAIDPGLRVYDAGLTELFASDTVVLGDDHLHTHMHWHIDSNVPGVDPLTESYGVEFRLLDTGATGYLPTDAYRLNFIPEPGTIAGLALALLLRRR
jgi:hypothetical protein